MYSVSVVVQYDIQCVLDVTRALSSELLPLLYLLLVRALLLSLAAWRRRTLSTYQSIVIIIIIIICHAEQRNVNRTEQRTSGTADLHHTDGSAFYSH